MTWRTSPSYNLHSAPQATAPSMQLTPLAEAPARETPAAFSVREFLPFVTHQAGLFLPPHVVFNQRDSEITLFKGKSI